MTITQPSDILEKVRNLISNSCKDYSATGNSFTSLHTGIVRLYFEAKNVEIDYDKKVILTEIPVGGGFTKVSFEYMDLERFLKSCVKSDKKSLLFYQNQLYNHLEVA